MQTLVDGTIFGLVGLNAIPFHFISITLHGCTTALAFRVLSQITTTKAAFFSALLWAVLPAHTEVVANPTSHSELLAAAFGLSALDSTLSRKPALLTSVLFLLALGSKESALVIPLLAILALTFRWEFSWSKLKPYVYVALPFLIVRTMIVGLPGASGSIDPLDNQLILETTGSRVFYSLVLLGKYALTALMPFELSADYSFNHLHLWLGPGSTVALASFAIFLGMFALCWSRVNDVRTGLRWFFLAFLITSNVFLTIGTVFAERLLYVPSLGIVLAFVGWLGRVRLRRFGAALFIAYSVISSLHDPIWRSNRALYTYQMGISPRSAKTQHNYGVLLRNNGELDDASIHVRQALNIYPCYADAASTLGSIYLLRSTPSGAQHWFRKALDCAPGHPPTLNRLGRLMFNQGNTAAAKEKFLQVLTSYPNDIEAVAGLLAVAIKTGDNTEAKRLLAYLDAVVPDSKEVNDLRTALEKNAR